MMQSQLFYTYNYMVKVRLFWWWCCVCCIVLSTLCIIILQARHDHNNIVPCGMIKVFWTELNWTELNGLRQSTILDNGHQNKIKIKDSHSVLWFWIRSHLSPHRPPIFTQNIFFLNCFQHILACRIQVWYFCPGLVTFISSSRELIWLLSPENISDSSSNSTTVSLEKTTFKCSKLFQLHQSRAKPYKVHYFKVSTSTTGYMYIYGNIFFFFSIICMKRKCATLIYKAKTKFWSRNAQNKVLHKFNEQ